MEKLPVFGFQPVKEGNGHWVFHFPNGYGASIISRDSKGEWYELAVLRKDPWSRGRWHICYKTPLTNYVLGLKADEVQPTLETISRLGHPKVS